MSTIYERFGKDVATGDVIVSPFWLVPMMLRSTDPSGIIFNTIRNSCINTPKCRNDCGEMMSRTILRV